MCRLLGPWGTLGEAEPVARTVETKQGEMGDDDVLLLYTIIDILRMFTDLCMSMIYMLYTNMYIYIYTHIFDVCVYIYIYIFHHISTKHTNRFQNSDMDSLGLYFAIYYSQPYDYHLCFSKMKNMEWTVVTENILKWSGQIYF